MRFLLLILVTALVPFKATAEIDGRAEAKTKFAEYKDAFSISTFYESRSFNHAEGFKIALHTDASLHFDKTDDIDVFAGVSASKITSHKVIDGLNDKSISPLYFFFGARLPLLLSPYFEIGTDIGDTFFDQIFNGDGESIDSYVSVGITSNFKFFGASLYHTNYNLFSLAGEEDIQMTGVDFFLFF